MAPRGPGPARFLWAVLAVLAFDLLLVLVTPGHSLLSPLGAPPVGGLGLGVRLLAVALLLLALPVARRTLWLCLLPALLHFHSVSGRLSGDGVMYYVQLRSLMADGDIDLTNEYQQVGLLERPELRMPTDTGLRRTVFSIGPALLGAPFYALAEGLGRGGRLLGIHADMSGWGPLHVNTVALGGLLLGFAAVWVVESTLRRHFAARTARWAALLTWGATFLYWYMVQQPTMAHAPSAFAAALFIWEWDRTRGEPGTRSALTLGLLGGLAMCVRWQNAVLLALPAFDLVREARAVRVRVPARRALLLLAATLAAALPQMLVWRAIFGVWVLGAPPQGTDFVRLFRPFVLETLFASRHGVLSWTPVLWAGYLGFVPLWRRRPALAGPLLIPLVVITYVNMCSGDWWAGGSFSNRRFDSLLPVLAFGLAASCDAARALLQRRPGWAMALVVVPAVAWNLARLEARRQGWLPEDDTVSFERAVEAAARAAAVHVGSPPAWPANWIFAVRYGLTPDRFDLLAGRYLFYRQNNQQGCVEPGRDAFAAQLDGPWRVEETGEGPAASIEGRGRVLVGLDLPEDLDVVLRVQAAAPAAVVLEVNGVAAGEAPVGPEWNTRRLRVPRARWRRDLNAVGLRTPVRLRVRGMRFDRQQGEPSSPCGMEAP